MKCIECGKQTQVIDSREDVKGMRVRRRRKCRDNKCKARATSYEIYDGSENIELTEMKKVNEMAAQIISYLTKTHQGVNDLHKFLGDICRQNQ